LLAERGLDKELEELCRQRTQEICQAFPDWQVVPPKLRSQAKKLQSYGQGLMAVAEKMVALGEDGPMDLLAQTHGDGNPSSWRSGLKQAIKAMSSLKFVEAVRLLEPYLIAGSGQQGGEEYLGITLGKLGECECELGHFDKAEAHYKKAINVCQQHSDWEGVFAYHGALYQLERYRGQGDVAQTYAIKLGQLMKAQGLDTSQAKNMAMAAMKPPVRVVASLGGQRYEMDQLPAQDGQVQFFFERNRPTLALAAAQIQAGRAAAEAGQYQAALDHFSKAAQIDSYEPDSRYLAGLSLLHLKRYAEASATYKQLERLAPGWYQSRHDAWMAQELAAGRLSHEAWLLALELSDRPAAGQEQLQRCEAGLAKLPSFAPYHFCRARALLGLSQKNEANAAFQQALEFAANDDLKSRIFIEASQLVGNPAIRQQILSQVVSLKNGNLVAVATAQYLLKFIPS